MKLNKRIILSRHGIRYPLASISSMEEAVGTKFVNWKFEDKVKGHLTKKGQLLELELAQEIKDIFNIDEIDYIFANSLHRTFSTARSIDLGINPIKNNKINILNKDFSKMDFDFCHIFNDENVILKDEIVEVDKKLAKVYKRMEEILKLEEGTISSKKTYYYLDEEGYMHVRGALRIATDICDLFILQYYEEFEEKDIFESDNFLEDLKLLATAKDEFLDATFGNIHYIKNSTRNVFNFIKKAINSDYNTSLFVGHDSNLSSIMRELNIDYTRNENSLEKYPIGAKLIFDIFDDGSYKLYLTYFSYDKIRKMDKSKPIVELIKEGNYEELK